MFLENIYLFQNLLVKQSYLLNNLYKVGDKNMNFEKLSKKIRRTSIKKKLFGIIIMQTIILIICYIYIISADRYKTLRQTESSSLQACSILLSSVSRNVENMKDISTFPVLRDSLGLTTNIYKTLSSSDEIIDDYSYYRSFNDNALRMLNMYNFVETIIVYDSNGNGVFVDRSSPYFKMCKANTNSQWFKETLKLKGKDMPIYPTNFYQSGTNMDDEIFCVSRAIVNAEMYKNVGIIVVGVKAEMAQLLFNECKEFPNQKYAVYLSGKKIIGDMPDNEKISPYILNPKLISNNKVIFNIKNRVKYMYTLSSYENNYVAVVETNTKDVWANVKLINFAFIFILGILLLFSIHITYRISDSIIKPINTLVYACNSFQQGVFSTQVEFESSVEIFNLMTSFNKMARKVEYLINEVYIRDITKRELEIDLLRNQINPHYLYNTLECMRMIAYTQKNYTVADMAALLGHNLRYGLQKNNDEVTVQEEIASLEEYISLIGYHYGDKVKANLNISQNVLQCLTIKLLLQPLVENSIMHGYNSIDKPITIDVIAYSQNNYLVFQVTDDGKGISSDKLQQLRDYLDGKNNDFSSIGLKNVHRRIKLYYGDDHGLLINSVEGQGTSITLSIPIN